jgi:CRP-like cAMP-binding protein
MAIDQILESLYRVPLFAGLMPGQIAEIGRGAQRRTFRKGEVIVEAGEAGDGAYLILSGDVICRAGPDGRGPTEPVEPGSLVGELAMLVEHDYGSVVVAQGWVDCLKVERATLHKQMRADPDIADRIADAIRGRLTLVAAELQLIERLLAKSIEQRAEMPLALMPPAAGQMPATAAFPQ